MEQCKVAICEWSLPIKGPSMFQIGKELGINGIQIDDWGSFGQSFPMSDKRIQKMYLDAAWEAEMEIPSLGCNGFSREGGLVNRLGTPEGDMSLLTIETGLRTCESMGIPLLMLPCCWGGYLKDEADYENAALMLRQVCGQAEEFPVTIGLESVLPPEKLKELIAFVDSDHFKLYYDTQNPQFFAGANPAEELRRLDLSQIAEIHFKDGYLRTQGCRCLGEGETGFHDIIEVLKAGNYSGWAVLENFYMRPVFESEIKDPFLLMKKDAETLRKAFVK